MKLVQRKLVDKLGIQIDHVESDNSRNLDSKNKGAADLKKTMDKSRLMQHSNIQGLRSRTAERSKDIHIPKPPTSDHVKTRAATPQRQSSEGSPNYMKSTSSFDARTERSQVSSQTPQDVMIRSISPVKSKNFGHNSGSDHKPVGAVARTSSLKVVRILIKTPSFKPARALTKKYSPIALCENFDVLKPTCSSTLKDSKMPMFLELSAGATESEGTSAVKVCPYTYCSLNGHHRDPLPPLKSFLSAKRRMLKAQKVIKIGCLSPRGSKPSREKMLKKEAKQVIMTEIPPTKEMDFDSRPITPLMHEKQTDFLVEIYRDSRDDDTAKEKFPETLSSTAPGSVIDFERNLEGEKDQNVEAGVKIHPFPRTQEDEILDCLRKQGNTEEESQQFIQYGQSDSEASEMELKEGHHNELSLDDVLYRKLKVTDIHNGSNIESMSNSEDDVINGCEDILLMDEVRVGFHDERSVSSWSNSGDSDWDGSYQDFIEQDQEGIHKNYNAAFNSTESLEPDNTRESRSSDDVLNQSFLEKTEGEDADQEDHVKKIITCNARDGMEEGEPLAAEFFDGIPTPDSLRETEQEKPITRTEGMERKEKLFEAKNSVRHQPSEFWHESPQCIPVNKVRCTQTDSTIVSERNQSYADETLAYESNGVENHEYPEINLDQLQTYEFKSSKYFEDQIHSGPAVLKATPNQNQEADRGVGENRTEPDAAETSIIVQASDIAQNRDHMSNANRTSNEEITHIAKHLSWTTGSRKTAAELEDMRDFNPREPNYLPAEPDYEPEKVDLRHQLMDERKNSEEWMVDYALRQAVTNLAPKRRRKVSLLVEAFEKVLPTPMYETRPSHTSSAFIHARTIQTCR